MPDPSGGDATIAIVGPCASGKSTLAIRLVAEGYRAHQIAQEHSYVPDMWQIFSAPDILIFLDSTFEDSQRRKPLDWTQQDHAEQQRRLAHARKYCDIYINTTGLTAEVVAQRALSELKRLLPD